MEAKGGGWAIHESRVANAEEAAATTRGSLSAGTNEQTVCFCVLVFFAVKFDKKKLRSIAQSTCQFTGWIRWNPLFSCDFMWGGILIGSENIFWA